MEIHVHQYVYVCGLIKKKIQSVSAFVAHGVFPKEAWKRFASGGDRNVFDKFWLTNSIPTITSTLPKDDVFQVRFYA